MRTTTIFLAALSLSVASCGKTGTKNSDANDDIDQPTVEPQEPGASSSVTFGRSSGNCAVKPGEACIDGFIGHGQAIRVAILDDGDNVEFRDGADFNDRFREAFVEPRFIREGLDAAGYDIALYPEVTRNNFAYGFIGYVQGTNSTSVHEAIVDPEGTFAIDRLEPGTYTIRLIKEILLVQTEKDDPANRVAQCLVFEHVSNDITVDGYDQDARIVHLGGVTSFAFYARPNRDRCSSRSALPPTDLAIPRSVTRDEGDQNEDSVE